MSAPNKVLNNSELAKHEQPVIKYADDRDQEIVHLRKELARVETENTRLKINNKAILEKFNSAKKRFESDKLSMEDAYMVAGVPKYISLKNVICKLKADLQIAVDENQKIISEHTTLQNTIKKISFEASQATAVMISKEELFHDKISLYETKLSHARLNTSMLKDLMESIDSDMDDFGYFLWSIRYGSSTQKVSMIEATKLRSKLQKQHVNVNHKILLLMEILAKENENVSTTEPVVKRSSPSQDVRISNNVASLAKVLPGRPPKQRMADPGRTRMIAREPSILNEVESEWTSIIQRVVVPDRKVENEDCPPEKRVKMEDVLASVDDVAIKQEEIGRQLTP